MKTAAEHLDELREQLKESLNINMSGALDILRHYGVENQLLKLAEECRELEQAANVIHHDMVCEEIYDDYGNLDNLIEEIADVCVVSYQILHWLGAENKVREIARQKIERTHERIAEEVKAKNDGD